MRISDWSSDVCSSDLVRHLSPTRGCPAALAPVLAFDQTLRDADLVDLAVQAGEVLVPEQGDSLLSAAPGDPVGPSAAQLLRQPRSEERRVGKEGVSPCRSRGSPYH